MERKDVIQIASEAGFGKLLTGDGLPTMWHGADLETLERFATLVAAAEREACAKLCDDKERDARERLRSDMAAGVAYLIGAAIRARSNLN